jgi:xylan 1,4-beta-xylosidase
MRNAFRSPRANALVGLTAGLACTLIAAAVPPAMATPNPSNTDPIAATVTVNWDSAVGKSTSRLFGTNDFQVSNPSGGADDPVYAKLLDQMGIHTFRLHVGGLTSDWTDPKTKDWDPAKIAKEYNAPYMRNATVIQNIPTWPRWCRDTDGLAEPVAYAAFAASLVKTVNVTLGKHVRYFEPMNEWNDAYAKNIPKLAETFNRAAVAMKAVDPGIKMTGPAFSWCNLGAMEGFLKVCGPNIDMVSWHRYGNCSEKDSTDTVMGQTVTMGADVTHVKALIDKYARGHHVETALDEYNIPCDWQEGDTRQWTNVGATFNASVVKNFAYAGGDILTTWASKDGIYGLIDPDDKLRPAAYFHQWGNESLVGTLRATASTHPMVEAMAVTRSHGERTLLLINKASGTATVTLAPDLGNLRVPNVMISSIDADGVHQPAKTPVANLFTRPIVMPPTSVLRIQIPRR